MATRDSINAELDVAISDVNARIAVLSGYKELATAKKYAHDVSTYKDTVVRATNERITLRDSLLETFIRYRDTNVFASSILDAILVEAKVIIRNFVLTAAEVIVAEEIEMRHAETAVRTQRNLTRYTFLYDLHTVLRNEYIRIKAVLATVDDSQVQARFNNEVTVSGATLKSWYADKQDIHSTSAEVTVSKIRSVRKRLKNLTFIYPYLSLHHADEIDKSVAERYSLVASYFSNSGCVRLPNGSFAALEDKQRVEVIPLHTIRIVDGVEEDWGMFVRSVPPYIYPAETELITEIREKFIFEYDRATNSLVSVPISEGVPYLDYGIATQQGVTYLRRPYRRCLGNMAIILNRPKRPEASSTFVAQQKGSNFTFTPTGGISIAINSYLKGRILQASAACQGLTGNALRDCTYAAQHQVFIDFYAEIATGSYSAENKVLITKHAKKCEEAFELSNLLKDIDAYSELL